MRPESLAQKRKGSCVSDHVRANLYDIALAWIIHEYRREAFETEARRGFSHGWPTQAYRQSVEETEGGKLRRARRSGGGAGIHE